MKKTTTVRFVPWVGSRYVEGLGSLRILLVCESHYGDRKHERPTATAEIVKALALDERHPLATRRLRGHPHFTKIMSAVKGVGYSINRAEKKHFWEHVAYYNFLQEFIRGTRVPPSQEVWERGDSAFLEVLSVLLPDLIICLSARNGNRIRLLAGDVPVAVVNHPSSRFAYVRVNPVIALHKELALVRKANIPAFIRSEAFVCWCEATASALPTPGAHLSESDKIAILAQRREAMATHDELSPSY